MAQLRIGYKALQDYLTYLLGQLGTSYSDARVVAEVLVEGELCEQYEYGVRLLDSFYLLCQAQRLDPVAEMEVTYQMPSTATINARGGFGPVAAKKAMQLAMEKARTTGVAWVAVTNSNPFGLATYYAQLAAEQGMLGFAMSNSAPVLAPYNSTQRMLGANPIAIAMPGQGKTVVVELNTASMSAMQVQTKVESNQRLPEGVLHDAMGQPTVDPSTLSRGGAMLPFGSSLKETAYMGYSLACIVDLLCAVLGGASFGPYVPPIVAYMPLPPQENGHGFGHLLGAVRMDGFQSGNQSVGAVNSWCNTIHAAKGIQGTSGVSIPGESLAATRVRNQKEGVVLAEETLRQLNRMAGELGARLLEEGEEVGAGSEPLQRKG